MDKQFKIKVEPNGTIVVIHSDDLRQLFAEGQTRISRASFVEPLGSDWTADLSPVGGPILGPVALRRIALDAEVAWLNEHLF